MTYVTYLEILSLIWIHIFKQSVLICSESCPLFYSPLWMSGAECCLLQASGAAACEPGRVGWKKSEAPGLWFGWDPHSAGSADQPSSQQRLLHPSGHHWRHTAAAGLPEPAGLLPLPPVSVPGCHHVGPPEPRGLGPAAAALSPGLHQSAPPAGGTALEVLSLCGPAAEKAGPLRLWPL